MKTISEYWPLFIPYIAWGLLIWYISVKIGDSPVVQFFKKADHALDIYIQNNGK